MVPALPPPLGLLRGRCRLHENGGEGDDDYDRADASMGGGVENDKFPEYDDGEA